MAAAATKNTAAATTRMESGGERGRSGDVRVEQVVGVEVAIAEKIAMPECASKLQRRVDQRGGEAGAISAGTPAFAAVCTPRRQPETDRDITKGGSRSLT